MTDFTPWSALAGGALIGLAASLLLFSSGRVAGISGIVFGAVLGGSRDRAWAVRFILGMLAAGAVFALWMPETVQPSPRSMWVVAVAGVLVGVGTRLGSGCTSGHGVCGVSRLSPRSLVATAIFVALGALTASIVGMLGAPS